MEPFLFGLHTVVRGSFLRRISLYLFAKFLEIPLLKVSYWATRPGGLIAKSRLIKGIVKASVARVLARMDTGVPTPADRVVELIEAQTGPIAVGPCRCRIAHKACSHPLETDIVIRSGAAAWLKAFPKDYRVISKEEAVEIVRRCSDAGMFQMVFVHCPAHDMEEYVICNCCTDGCVPYLANRFFGQDGFALIRGEYGAYVDRDRCELCGRCVDACPWDAREIVGDRLRIDEDACMGCGLCAAVCPAGAAKLKKVREIDWASLR